MKKLKLLKEGAWDAGGRTDSATRQILYFVKNVEFNILKKIFLTKARARQAGKRRDSAAKEFLNPGVTTGVSVHQLLRRKSRICLPQRNFAICTLKKSYFTTKFHQM